MHLFGTTKTNLIFVTHLLLSVLKIKVNYSTLVNYMEAHPQYPSLLTISDCLLKFKVPNEVRQIAIADYRKVELPAQFITHVSKDKGSFLLVQQINKHQLRLADEKDQNIIITKKEFFDTWEGILLFATPEENSGETDYYQQYIHLLLQKAALPALFIAVFTLLILLFSLQAFSWLLLGLSLIKATGLAFSIILLSHSINSSSAVVDKICGLVQKNDCNTILNSKAAHITTWLSWAEIGFFYFAGSFLSLLLLPVFLPVLFWTNLLALPFTIYSLLYQYQLKKWCVLCCAVLALLVLEFICFVTLLELSAQQLSGHFHLVLPLVLCYVFPVVVWGVLKPLFNHAARLKLTTYQLNNFRHNASLFNSALYKQKHYPIGQPLKPIKLGNPMAETVLTVVSNPFCQPCAKAHSFIEEWLRTRTDLQVQLILLVSNTPLQKKVAQHMIALGMAANQELLLEALSVWFQNEERDYEYWAIQYPVEITKKAKMAFVKQYLWATNAGIGYTPTVLLNGYKVPALYTLEDLPYLIT